MKTRSLSWINQLDESVLAIRIWLRIQSALLVLALALTLVAWLFAYFLTRVNLANWVADWWPTPIMIFAVLLFAFRRVVRRRNALWHELIDLGTADSSVLDEKQHGPVYLTGGIKFGTDLLGPVTITGNANGVSFWQFGRMVAFYQWGNMDSVAVRHNAKGGCYAELVLRNSCDRVVPKLVIPWDSELVNSIPASIRRANASS